MDEREAERARTVRITSREDLAFVLSEASTLEHMVMCEYLFAAFSMKKEADGGLSEAELDAVRKWEEVVSSVAVQEMTHLALVNNMLVSIGHGPYFLHANFPQPSRYFAPNVRLALMPFGEQALRHFLYLERPEGMAIEGVPGFELLGDLDPPGSGATIMPGKQYFSTVGSLYRGIELGIRALVERIGEDGVFIGGELAQATEDLFGLPGLVQVRDLNSAVEAIDGIVENGEGARGKWEDAHFGMFLRVFNEYMEAKRRNPRFNPTKPVVAAYSSPPSGTEEVPLITEEFTSSVSDLFNAGYSLAIGTLSRFYVHQADRSRELQTLASAAVEIMVSVVEPLGKTLTSLPVGARLPGITAGPTFELRQREYLLPQREQAFMVLQERLVELAEHAGNLSGRATSPAVSGSLSGVRDAALGLGVKLRPE